MDDARATQSRALARRRRRAARRRAEILAAAARVFSQKGYANATTREIADEADIAEGTLYNYFEGKREVLLAVAQETEAPMQAAVLEAGKLADRAAMIAMFERAFDLLDARLPFLRAVLTEAWTDDDILQDFVAVRLRRVAQLLQAFIADRVSSGHLRPIDPAIGARLAMGMFAGLILPSLRGVEPIPSPEERHRLAVMAVEVLLDGVRARAP